jgi:hypothetical protein
MPTTTLSDSNLMITDDSLKLTIAKAFSGDLFTTTSVVVHDTVEYPYSDVQVIEPTLNTSYESSCGGFIIKITDSNNQDQSIALATNSYSFAYSSVVSATNS